MKSLTRTIGLFDTIRMSASRSHNSSAGLGAFPERFPAQVQFGGDQVPVFGAAEDDDLAAVVPP